MTVPLLRPGEVTPGRSARQEAGQRPGGGLHEKGTSGPAVTFDLSALALLIRDLLRQLHPSLASNSLMDRSGSPVLLKKGKTAGSAAASTLCRLAPPARHPPPTLSQRGARRARRVFRPRPGVGFAWASHSQQRLGTSFPTRGCTSLLSAPPPPPHSCSPVRKERWPLRPRLLRWPAAPRELRRPLPGSGSPRHASERPFPDCPGSRRVPLPSQEGSNPHQASARCARPFQLVSHELERHPDDTRR